MRRAVVDIAVIIPARNAEETLEGAVRSAHRAAREATIEVVIVDDGSTDSTADIAGRLALRDRRAQLISQENRGLSAARNAGLEAARSEFVVFLDADDALTPASLDGLLRIARQSGGAGAVGAWWMAPDELWSDVERALAQSGPSMEVDLAKAAWRSDPPARGVDAGALALRNPAPAHAFLTARDAIGGARFDESLPMLEDWEFWRRLAARDARWTSAPIASAIYRLRRQSMSSADLRMCETAARIVSRNVDRHAATECGQVAMQHFALERAALAHCRAGCAGAVEEIVHHWLAGARVDADAIGSAVAFAFPHALRAPPAAWLDPPQDWLDRLGGLLDLLGAKGALAPEACSDIARVIAERAVAPAVVAQRIVEMADRAGAPIELVGLGVNGRAIADAARRAGVTVRARDDALPDPHAPAAELQLPAGAALKAPEAPRTPGAFVVLSPERDDALLPRFDPPVIRWRLVRAEIARGAAERIAGAVCSAHAHAG